MSVHVKVGGKWQEIGVDGGGGFKWAKVTGGTLTEVTNPDGSVDEVHTFTADGPLTVVQEGYARVLCVGGGAKGIAAGYIGNGGYVISGIHSLPAGSHAVTVGAAGLGLGGASSIGSLRIAAAGGSTHTETAASGANVTSDISGTSVVYSKKAVSGQAANTPGSGSFFDTGNAANGIVIVRVQKSAPTVLGGAAVISGGTVTRAVGTDGRTYDFHTYTASDTNGPTVTTSGRARVLVVGGAGGNSGDGGGGAGGYLDLALDLVAGQSYPIGVGAAGANNGQGTVGGTGGESWFGAFRALGGGGGANSVSAGTAGASGGGGSRAADNMQGRAILTYGRQGYDGATGWVGGAAGGAGGGGAASTGWSRLDGQPTNGRGGEGRMWIDGQWYSSAGNHSPDATVTAGQTPYNTAPRANSGMSGGGYLQPSAAGIVIIAIEVAP